MKQGWNLLLWITRRHVNQTDREREKHHTIQYPHLVLLCVVQGLDDNIYGHVLLRQEPMEPGKIQFQRLLSTEESKQRSKEDEKEPVTLTLFHGGLQITSNLNSRSFEWSLRGVRFVSSNHRSTW